MPWVIHNPLPAPFGRASYTVDDEKGFEGGECFLRDFWRAGRTGGLARLRGQPQPFGISRVTADWGGSRDSRFSGVTILEERENKWFSPSGHLVFRRGRATPSKTCKQFTPRPEEARCV